MFGSRLPWSDYPFREFDDPEPQERPHKRLFIILKAMGVVCVSLLAGSMLLVLILRWMAVPTSAFMLQYAGGDKKPQYRWTAWDRISPAAAIAVVAAEDQNFPNHWGFDFEAIADAIDENKTRSRPRGASTITQQTAKNLFLWPGRSWMRKGLEAYFTVLIELFWPKRRILEVYLNIAEFGPGIYGIGAAGRIYFGVLPAKLTNEQAALLAAVLPNPRRMSVARPSAYVRQRAGQIRRQMQMLGGSAYLYAIYQ